MGIFLLQRLLLKFFQGLIRLSLTVESLMSSFLLTCPMSTACLPEPWCWSMRKLFKRLYMSSYELFVRANSGSYSLKNLRYLIHFFVCPSLLFFMRVRSFVTFLFLFFIRYYYGSFVLVGMRNFFHVDWLHLRYT